MVRFIRVTLGQYEFSVNGYGVYFKDGVWWCDCMDFKNRWDVTGGFTCKHIIGAVFKLFELFKENGGVIV